MMDNELKTQITGIVLYTDGGARPNPGFGGKGFHGYAYAETTEGEPVKHGKPAKYETTDFGYIPHDVMFDSKKSKGLTAVTPLCYLDGYGSYGEAVTNNVCELEAATEIFQLALEDFPNLQKLTVLTDSQYVVKGTTEHLANWVVNQWRRQDGQVIKNQPLWNKLHQQTQSLTAKNIQYKLKWVKGHSDDIGNSKADTFASLGVVTSRQQQKTLNEMNYSSPLNYWKVDSIEKHPFIAHSRIYFNTQQEFITPGQYYLGNHGKDDDLLGMRQSDGAMAFVVLAEPEQVIETVRDYLCFLAANTDNIVLGRLDALFKPNVYRMIEKYGTCALDQMSPDRLDVYAVSKEPLIRELRPARLSFRAIDELSNLSALLHQYCEGSSELVVTDLTDNFYEKKVVEKKGKPPTITYKLNKNFVVGIPSTPIVGQYQGHGEVKETDLILSFGIDIPDRNTFRRLETMNPTVQLITWKESDKAFRYATVITTSNGDRSIWAGVYSNLHLLAD